MNLPIPTCPQSCGPFLVLQALMLCCCSTNSPVVPFPSTPKSVKSSMQMESLQLEFMLSCPFFSTKKNCTFLLSNCLKDFILYLFLQKGYKGEECSNCCTCIIIPVSKNSQPAFFLLRFSRRLQGQNHKYRVPSFGNI